MSLPKDITNKIEVDFKNETSKNSVLNFLTEVHNQNWNVGKDQLCRSLLILLESDVKRINDLKNFYDPRDVIQRAEIKMGNPGHYFIKPFD